MNLLNLPSSFLAGFISRTDGLFWTLDFVGLLDFVPVKSGRVSSEEGVCSISYKFFLINLQQLIKLFLEVQQQSNETISKLTNEIKLLKENYNKLESNISVSKTVSSLLTEQMNNVERQCWANA